MSTEYVLAEARGLMCEVFVFRQPAAFNSIVLKLNVTNCHPLSSDRGHYESNLAIKEWEFFLRI